MDFILWDVVALQLAFIVAYAIRQGGALPYASEQYGALAVMFVVVDILVAAIFNTMHNVMKRGYYQEFVQSIKQIVLVLAIMSLYMFSMKSGDTFSRITVYLTAGFHLVFGYLIRLAWKPITRRIVKDKPKPTLILVAEERRIPEIVETAAPTGDFEIKGLVISDRDAAGEKIYGIKVVANLADAADYICREWVDEVFIYPEYLKDIEVKSTATLETAGDLIEDTYDTFVKKEHKFKPEPEPDGPSVSTLIDQCRQMAIPVHIRLPLSHIGGKSFMEKVGGYTVLTTASNYASPLQLALKRLVNIIGGLVGSFMALIVMAIIGPMIKKESPGPILFKQTRIGKNGKKFQIYKLRSMYLDAEERKKELLKDNRVSDGMMFKLDWDPRIIGNKIVDGKQVTGIGEFIRSRSLDEFPQFFNVLLNQMSLVGTRPPTEDEWEKYKYHHRARLAMKPGITGLWQVSGRSKITDFEEVVRLDTEYINNWSVGLDIKILLKTVKAVLKKDGAM